MIWCCIYQLITRRSAAHAVLLMLMSSQRNSLLAPMLSVARTKPIIVIWWDTDQSSSICSWPGYLRWCWSNVNTLQRTVCQCFAILRQLSSVCLSVPTFTLQTLTASLVLSRLDYGNNAAWSTAHLQPTFLGPHLWCCSQPPLASVARESDVQGCWCSKPYMDQHQSTWVDWSCRWPTWTSFPPLHMFYSWAGSIHQTCLLSAARHSLSTSQLLKAYLYTVSFPSYLMDSGSWSD